MILELGIDGLAGGKELAGVAPVHEHEMDRSALGVLSGQRQRVVQKLNEIVAGQFARALNELPMLGLAAA